MSAGATIGGFIGGEIGLAVGGLGCIAGAGTFIVDVVICPTSLVVGTVAGGYLGGLFGGWVGRSVHQHSRASWS